MPSATIDVPSAHGRRSGESLGTPPGEAPIICFSHLRWDFVTQRPQHLMRRFAGDRKVFFFEEYIPCDHPLPYLEFHPFPADGVVAITPAQLCYMLEGIDWRHPQRTWRPSTAG